MRTPLLLASVVYAAVAVAPVGADITPANVADLVLKWEANTGAVTGGPIVRDGRVYVGAWSGYVYALDPTTGAEIWKTSTGGPIPGRVLVLDDGGVCYGTLFAGVGCLNGSDGSVRWQTSLSEPAPGAVWSAPIAANGRLFVGVASLSDQPCTRGRLVALDLATGTELWRFYTVPEKVCTTDTATTCSADGDCPSGGTCITGIGGGVTATPAVDPTGQWVYMNTVGCYTSPSIGESDSMFKIDATTGDVTWRHRVNAPEQFGTCVGDTSVDCGVAADCTAVGGPCQKKAFYHDFGFLNGPSRVEVPDGLGGTDVLIVSASKNGTLYAFDEASGDYAWTNVLRATPISPGFAGFGLFNGAINVADGRIFAALYTMLPSRVCSNDARKGCTADTDCPGGTCPLENQHLKAFDVATGAEIWSAEIGQSWSHVGVANGVVYAGTQVSDAATGRSFLYAHDAASGVRLATFDLPQSSAARAAVSGDSVFVGYGVTAGGTRALSLCGNGSVDPGEACDGGIGGLPDCCTAACTLEPAGTACGAQGGDVCTPSSCDAGGACIGGTPTTVAELACTLAELQASPCGAEALPDNLARAVTRAVARLGRILDKAAALAAQGVTEKVERSRATALKRLDDLAEKVLKATRARRVDRRISPACQGALDALIAERRAIVESFVF